MDVTVTEAYGVGWTDGQVDGGVMDKGWITGPSGVFHAKGFTILSWGKWGVVDFCAGECLREAGCGGEGPGDSGEPRERAAGWPEQGPTALSHAGCWSSGSGGRRGGGPWGRKRPRCSAATEHGCSCARLCPRAPSRPAPSGQDGPAAAACPTAPDPVKPQPLLLPPEGAHSGGGFVSPSQRWICSPLYEAFLGSNTCSSRSEFSGWLN